MGEEYVLRKRDDEEVQRLRFQHQVWQEETRLAIRQAGVNRGDRVVDLGCGPGYLGRDLLEYVGQQGKVYCLDNSKKFIEFIRKLGIENLLPVRADIRSELPDHFDQLADINRIFCRWVLMFTGNAEKIIGEIYRMLAPGGKFISIEYFDFRRISIFPGSDPFDTLYHNVWELLRRGGGDPDVGGKVYRIMREKGFGNVEVFPVYRTGKVNSDLWKWLAQTNENHTNLVDNQLITAEELNAYLTDWAERSMDETSFITAPPLMITIGQK